MDEPRQGDWNSDEDGGDAMGLGMSRSEFRSQLTSLVERCIDADSWPLEVTFAIDLNFQRSRIVPRLRLLPSDPPSPPPMLVVNATCTFSRDRFRQMLLEGFEEDVHRHRSPLAGLATLARIDRPCFLETAANYLANRLESPENSMPPEVLAPLVLHLHELDPELPSDLVTHTRSHSVRAARRLRDMILDAIDEHGCAEALGLLAAQALRDRLEEA